ncbi:MAG: AAA family ATPase [Kofleriaceae bacterium]|nr:AAA family ATPase [Kofleriaceae bacterium]
MAADDAPSADALADAAAAAAAPAPAIAAPAPAIPYDDGRLRPALRQLAAGLAALHAAGKVHRDIKPSNILVTDEGRVVLLDFGLVTEAAMTEASRDDVVGTVAYMAPEQALSGDVTTAADWYSFGVVLYEALTGVLPHDGATPYELLLRKQQREVVPPRQLVATVPEDLDALCTALLQPHVRDRPAAAEILERLGRDDASATAGAAVGDGPEAAPFVGRADELRRLRDGYARSRDAALVCLVEGVSGVGKTQLVDRFLEQLARDEPDTVVLTSRCYEREAVSYKAFDGIALGLTRYLAHLPAVQVAELMPRRPALLARLFPVLKRVEAIATAAPVPDLADPHDQRRRMFAALRELFLRLTARRRVVWFIDDLQWTDADSLVLLQELVAHEDRLAVFIVATLRADDAPPQQALLARLAELAPTERLRLDELAPGEARELAGLLLPGRDRATLDAVAADAGGHPLFLQELARHSDGVAGAAAAAPGATFDEMLTARIDRLPRDARALLEVVALAGGPLSQEVAALATSLSSADQIKAATVLRAAHLARTDGVRRHDRIVAYHDRVREHVSARLDAPRRQHLHERLAIALEQTGAAAHDPRALVRHARAAGQREIAAGHARAAARHAMTALAFDQAAEFFAIALELGSYDQDTARGLEIELATALMHAGRGPEAAAHFVAAAEGADPAVRLDCQRQAADQWIITGHLERGMEALRSSLADIGEPLAATPRRALARVLWNRTRLRLRGVRHELRRDTQVPVETLRQLDVLKAVAHGLAMVDNIRGADFNGRFLLLALATGESRRLVAALATEVVFLASQAGRAGRRARRLYDELARLADDCPDAAFARTWLLLADGAACFFEGRFAPAARALEEAERVSTEGQEGMTYERNNTRVFRIHTLRLLGALRQQHALIREFVRGGQQRGDRYLVTTLRLLQGQALLARDDRDAARASVDEVSWSPPDRGFHLQHWYELRARVELAIYEGAAAAAVPRLAPTFAALERSMLLRVKLVRADAVALRGRLLLAAVAEGAAPPASLAEVRRLVRELRGERAGYATVYAHLLAAGVAALDRRPPRDDDDDDVTWLRRAVDDAGRHDMALHHAAAQAALGARLGGDEGARLSAAAATYAADEGVVEPARFFAVQAPGLGRR